MAPIPGPSSSSDQVLGERIAPSWQLRLIPSPVPVTGFLGVQRACRVSILGCWSLAMTLPAGVDHPESQEVMVSREACLQFGTGCLSGAAIAPFQLWLPSSACLGGDGLVRSQLSLLSPLFCECAWQCLRLGLFAGSWDSYPTVWAAISSQFPQIALRAFRPGPYPKQCSPLLPGPPRLASGGCERLGCCSAGNCC